MRNTFLNNNIDVYAEKPRPNLYNVVKKLRENSVSEKRKLKQYITSLAWLGQV